MIRSRDTQHEDCERFANYKQALKDCEQQIVESWQRIFDLDWYDEDCTNPRPEKMIQSIVWEIELEQICKVKEFIC